MIIETFVYPMIELPDFYKSFLKDKISSATLNFIKKKGGTSISCEMQCTKRSINLIILIIVWLNMHEQFYCQMNGCELQEGPTVEHTQYTCKSATCKCLPGAQLCDAKQSIDLSPMLVDIVGPASISCNKNGKCTFSGKYCHFACLKYVY